VDAAEVEIQIRHPELGEGPVPLPSRVSSVTGGFPAGLELVADLGGEARVELAGEEDSAKIRRVDRRRGALD